LSPKRSNTRKPAPASLARVLTYEILEDVAEERFYERGLIYHAEKRVGPLLDDGTMVSAKVRGQSVYQVELWNDDGELGFSCDCPIGSNDLFCKHCVAVALAWLGGKAPKAATAARSDASSGDSAVRTFLKRQDKRVLVDLLVEQAHSDDLLRDRLQLKAAGQRKKGPDLAAFRRAVDRAVRTGDFVDYHEVRSYARGIENVVDSIADVLREGHAGAVIELAEYALHAIERSIEHVDDSDGNLGYVMDQLHEIHLAACQAAKPDPEALATRLFAWELESEWEVFHRAAEEYASVLGEKGLAVYRRLAEAEWKHVPPLRPGCSGMHEWERSRITSIMETLARLSGDVDQMIAVKRRDLSAAYDFLQVARICKDAGRDDQALDWAERGLRAFPRQTDGRLREFLADEYLRLNRRDDAMTLIWTEFGDSARLESYQVLKAYADRIHAWPKLREKALAFIRESIANHKPAGGPNQQGWLRRVDHSELVRIFLWEEDIDTAWREAQSGGCTNDLWLELAKVREKDHPEDAIDIYKRQIEPTLARKNNWSYEEAVKYLRKINGLMKRIGRGEAFGDYLLALRVDHKRKINFMKLLDAAKWI